MLASEVHMCVYQNSGNMFSESDDDAIDNAVKSSELKWLPEGSELQMASTNPNPSTNPNAKPKTYTSFNCRQDSLPEFSNKPLRPKYGDITIAVLGAGQVILIITHLN